MCCADQVYAAFTWLKQVLMMGLAIIWIWFYMDTTKVLRFTSPGYNIYKLCYGRVIQKNILWAADPENNNFRWVLVELK